MRTLLCVDGYSLIYRAFHALPLLTSPDGTYTNAVHGFFNMLFKALTDFRPDGLCVMMDMHAPTFRHLTYSEYKGNRKPMPDELRPQVPVIREILNAMHVRICEMEGYEADDLLGTAARIANAQGIHTYILTGDRDSLQLVNADTELILTRKGITEILLLNEEGVRENFGILPEQVPDMKGLMGDSSDNIPGIAGVGEKTALKLINEYSSLDSVLDHADEIKGKLGEKIRAGKQDALLSRDLGTIRRDAPLELDPTGCNWDNMKDAMGILQKYELKSLIKALALLCGDSEDNAVPVAVTAAARRAAGGSAAAVSADFGKTAEREETLPETPVQTGDVTLSNLQELEEKVQQLVCVQPAWFVLNDAANEISLLTPDLMLWHMPISQDLLGGGLYEDVILHALKPLIEKIPVIIHNAKAFFHKLDDYSLPVPAVHHDTMIAAYLLHTAQKDFDLVSTLTAESCESANPTALSVYILSLRQRVRLESRGMISLMDDIEQPLTRVLYQMEKEGFKVDAQVLTELSTWFSAEVEECRELVYRETGFRDFNLNSPRQLGEVLYERLGLPKPQKKGSTGYTTNAEALEALADLHPAIEPLLRYRRMSKLQSTYIEGLQKLHGADGRIHTTFDQTATVTGRISSLEPNLQNIPIRTEEGREIRRAFVAGEGNILIDADYSQIELRVLAHMSGDEAMCDAFCKGQDIHTRTAAEIHGVRMEEVTPQMRRSAKAINFGIVYGISGFGLARNAHISRSDANRFIELYFKRYPGVKRFMDECVEKGKDLGYAETLFNRRRELYELSSSNRNVRSFGERAAMNTPVQGTAADIIKLAMVQVARKMNETGLKAKLILQVHDELVVECPAEEEDTVTALIRDIMEHVTKLKVPLLCDIHSGKNWDDAH